MLVLWLIGVVLVALLSIPAIIKHVLRQQARYFNFKVASYCTISDVMGIFDSTMISMFHKFAFSIPSARFTFKGGRLVLKIPLVKLYLDLKVSH